MLQQRGSTSSGCGWNDGGVLPRARHLLWSGLRYTSHPGGPAPGHWTRTWQHYAQLG